MRTGMDADLTLLEGDPAHDINAFANVALTIRSGQIIYQKRGVRETCILAPRPCPQDYFLFGWLASSCQVADALVVKLISTEKCASSEGRYEHNQVRAIVGGTCLFQITALVRSSSSGFVKRLDGINLRGAPKRNRR